MTKILLIGEKLLHRSFNGANKALPVLASSLCNAGFSNTVQLDLERSDITIEDVCRHASDADLITFAGCLTPQWPEIDKHLQQVHAHLERIGRTDVPIIVGGYATKSVEDIARLSPWITAFFDGEGEEGIVTIAELVAAGTFRQRMKEIPGICFLTENGTYHQSTAERVKNISPYDQHFEFVHVPEVHNMDIFVTPDGRQMKTAQLYTQRGCPWSCDYCNKSTESNGVNRLTEESLREQLRKLKRDGYEAVYLDVDTFTVNEKAARREAEIILEEGLSWGSNTRIDRVDKSLMRFLAGTNCIYMFFGVEHILPEVSIAIGKFNGPARNQWKQALEYPRKVRQVFTDMSECGFPSSYFLILGLPKAQVDETGQILGFEPTTFEDDMGAIRYGLDHCNPDYFNFNMLRFMPGSTAADMWMHPAYGCVRPSGIRPITGGYFLPRVARQLNYKVPENHGVYRLCESVGLNQPTTTAMDPQRVYDTVKGTMELINDGIGRGRKPTRIFIDRDIIQSGLVTRSDEGEYRMAPLREFEYF